VNGVQTDIAYRLILASASPARRALLKAAGIDADAVVSGVDESVVEAEDAYTLSLALARMKARTVAAGMRAEPGVLILGCDSVLAFDGEILGKPLDADDARRMLRRLSGRSHKVHTGVAVRAGSRVEAEVVTTIVTFTPLSPALVEWYLGTGEPFDKAGAYAIQGHGGAFVETVRGSVSNVVGLPLTATARLLALVTGWRASPAANPPE
jgi:septum formation protein